MKKLFLSLALILTLSIARVAAPASASANDFSFKSFEGDYYLEKGTNGEGNLKIEETLIASFTIPNQNHGIERCIPTRYRNSGSLEVSSIDVYQDNLPAIFTPRNTSDGFTCIRIGNASEYVYGEVEYEIVYNYKNVIVSYADTDYQELYWDTNGTSWSQPFGSLTARLHLDDATYTALQPDQKLITPFSCYVGSYGESGQSRCRITESTSDTEHIITFATQNLRAGENLTMNAMFKTGTFAAITQAKSLLLIGIMLALTGIYISIIAVLLNKRKKQADKISAAKAPAPVQYTPMPNMTVAQMKEVYLKSTKGSANVATLIELAVRHKIELEKGEKKRFGGYHWKVHVKNLDEVVREQEIVLEILNGGKEVSVGDTIEVKNHTATSTLQLLAKSFGEKVEDALKTKGLYEESTKKSSGAAALLIFVIVFFLIFGFSGFAVLIELLSDLTKNTGNVIYVGGTVFAIFLPISIVAFLIITIAISANTAKYKRRTLKGIEASKYLDGLKEYMELAEADRLKFLQSVKGADTTNNGIVKLYEKLLPYAIIFDIEDSWMDELNKYYNMADVSDPTWVAHGVLLSSRDFRTFNTYTASTISSSTMSSSSGSSSGFSGGGGGGFSGGGGGGGGGGGW